MAGRRQNRDAWRGRVTQVRRPIPVPTPSLTLDRPGSPGIKNASLEIAAGLKIGICGRTGRQDTSTPPILLVLILCSGKSSLVATFARLLEIDHGVIKIDGYDLVTLPRDTIRERLVAVPQDAPIFIGTLRFNMDPEGRQSDADIQAALSRVGLWAAFETGSGLDTEITTTSLSHGQRQLLSIGRALLKGGKVVLLDEPTSSVDEETDATVQRVLRDEFRGCTVITVAHRLNTIYPGSDVVVVMEGGQVAEAGAPDELMRRDGPFAQLVRDAQA